MAFIQTRAVLRKEIHWSVMVCKTPYEAGEICCACTDLQFHPESALNSKSCAIGYMIIHLTWLRCLGLVNLHRKISSSCDWLYISALPDPNCQEQLAINQVKIMENIQESTHLSIKLLLM